MRSFTLSVLAIGILLLAACVPETATPEPPDSARSATATPSPSPPQTPVPGPWEIVHPRDYNLYGVSSGPDGLLLAATTDRYQVASSDGGRTWRVFRIDYLPVSSSFFLDANAGWAMVWDRGIYRTDDGGKRWEFLTGSLKRGGMFFLNKNIGWLSGEDGLFSTRDGGSTWESMVSYGSSFVPVTNYHFVTATQGWVGGGLYAYWPDRPPGQGIPPVMPAYSLYKTTDSGATFREVRAIPEWGHWEDRPTSLTFVDSQMGWVVSEKGLIIRTDDGGNTWLRQTSGCAGRLDKVQFVDKDHGWIHIRQGLQNQSLFLRTTDGGATWERHAYLALRFLNDFHFIDVHNGWAVGDRLVLHTDDGGLTWSVVYDGS